MRLISQPLNYAIGFIMLIGCVLAVNAATRDGNSEDNNNSTKQTESDARDSTRKLIGPISIEDSMRLRQDLDEYSRQVDPAHVQIEERRRVMHERVQARFAEADKDNDGTISREEAADVLPQVARRFNQVDINNDGLVSLDELEALQARLISQRPTVIKIESPENNNAEQQKKKNKNALMTTRKRSL